MITITRKIQVSILADTKDDLKASFDKIYGWQRICHKAANWIVVHHYLQDNIKNLFYLTDEVKVKLGDMKKDADGILTTSRNNTTYQVLSKAFKGECPMGMLSGLNMLIVKIYKEEAEAVRKGLKSLRSYRRDVPMPIRRGDVANITKTDDNNYTFTVYGLQFKTWFGRDLSGNRLIFERALTGEYKWCDSSLVIRGKKMFLLAVFSFEKQQEEVDPQKIAYAELDINAPIKVTIGKNEIAIGTADEFLHRRLSIQHSLRRAQIGSRFNKGGKGRQKKMKATDHFHEQESNYVETRIHQYTFKLVDLCRKHKCGTLVLKNQEQKEEEAKQEKEFLLRNWSYYSMKEKIAYKCAKAGIELVVE